MNNAPRNNGRPRRSVTVQFCEPFLVNAAVFTGLIIVDALNNKNDLIPFHAVTGIIITVLTIVLCNYDLLALSWALAVIPSIFFLLTTLYAISQSKTFIAAEQGLGNIFGAARDKITYAADTIGDTVGYAARQATAGVDYVNRYGQNTYNAAGQTISSAGKSVGDAWNSVFNAQVKAGVDPAKAAVVATATAGAPAAGTAAATTATAAIATAPSVTVKGEYLYICGDGVDPKTAAPSSMAESCKYVSQQCSGSKDPDCYDKLIGVVSVPAVCLGMLATGGMPPSATARNNCLACDPNLDAEALKKCRCTAMNNCPTSTPVVAPVTTGTAAGAGATMVAAVPATGAPVVATTVPVSAAPVGTVSVPRAVVPVAQSAQPFTNYGSW
jgi:uncharacterized membrane protein